MLLSRHVSWSPGSRLQSHFVQQLPHQVRIGLYNVPCCKLFSLYSSSLAARSTHSSPRVTAPTSDPTAHALRPIPSLLLAVGFPSSSLPAAACLPTRAGHTKSFTRTGASRELAGQFWLRSEHHVPERGKPIPMLFNCSDFTACRFITRVPKRMPLNPHFPSPGDPAAVQHHMT